MFWLFLPVLIKWICDEFRIKGNVGQAVAVLHSTDNPRPVVGTEVNDKLSWGCIKKNSKYKNSVKSTHLSGTDLWEDDLLTKKRAISQIFYCHSWSTVTALFTALFLVTVLCYAIFLSLLYFVIFVYVRWKQSLTFMAELLNYIGLKHLGGISIPDSMVTECGSLFRHIHDMLREYIHVLYRFLFWS